MKNCMHLVFVINGHNGAGKDEFVNQFIKASEENGNHYRVSNISTIDLIKQMITRPYLWDGKTKDEKSRQLMHDIKVAVDRYNGFSITSTIHRVEAFRKKNAFIRTVSFIHCREPEKINSLVALFNKNFPDKYMVGTILVKRDSNSIAKNYADQNVDNYKYDITIDNNSTIEALYDKAKGIVELCDRLSGVDENTPAVSTISDDGWY